jgi:hypothetical protein
MLNGKPVAGEFVKADTLQPANVWDIFLSTPLSDPPAAPVRIVDVSDGQAIFGPLQPAWQDDPQGGLGIENGRVVLNYRDDDSGNITFNIYRDGQPCAQGIRETRWTDPRSGDYQDTVHTYAVAAVDVSSGNVSHLTPSRSYRTEDQKQVIPATAMQNRGGNLVGNNHFENWGRPTDELEANSIQVNRPGHYLIRTEFSNGAGPVNTGITCAVKKLEVRKAVSGEVVASGYLVMPQSGNWNRWDLSSSVSANLNPSDKYTIRIFEDEYSRNMSYLKNNDRYSAGTGGGEQSSNYVNISSVHLLYTDHSD